MTRTGAGRQDYERRAVDTKCIWNFTATVPYTAIFRENLGCTLVEGLTEAELRAQETGDVTPPPPLDPNVEWPVGEAGPTSDIPPGVDMDCLRERVVGAAPALAPQVGGGAGRGRTTPSDPVLPLNIVGVCGRAQAEQFADTGANPRGITVVYGGRLIYERYQEDAAGNPVVTKDSRLIGWSATKSVVNGLIGVLSGEGLIDVNQPAPVPEWAGERGGRRHGGAPWRRSVV
eukprot:COSAG01_NODE_8142_length_2904_cov_2.717848_2_plen_231_part_00